MTPEIWQIDSALIVAKSPPRVRILAQVRNSSTLPDTTVELAIDSTHDCVGVLVPFRVCQAAHLSSAVRDWFSNPRVPPLFTDVLLENALTRET